MSASHVTVRRFIAIHLAAATLAAAAPLAHAGFDQFSEGGTTLGSSIQDTIDAFRAAIGGANNANAAGPIVGGRREINWDGAAATMASNVGTPFTGFQNSRGGTFTTPGTGFTQSPLGDAALTGIQASYATTFSVFSAQRIFTPLGSNITEVTFAIPGTGGATPATASAFGAVFSDVDLANTTTIEFFNLANATIHLLNVLPGLDGAAEAPTLSFAGAVANAGERIARVRITTGDGALGPVDTNGNPDDLVVMDDFIYAEPIAVPEPTSAVLATAGAILLAGVRRRQRQS